MSFPELPKHSDVTNLPQASKRLSKNDVTVAGRKVTIGEKGNTSVTKVLNEMVKKEVISSDEAHKIERQFAYHDRVKNRQFTQVKSEITKTVEDLKKNYHITINEK